MELLSTKLLEQIAFNTRPKIEEHLLIVMHVSTHEEHLSQPLQTNNKQFKVAITFLSGYNSLFNVSDKNNKFYFLKSISDEDGYIVITIRPGIYEIESLDLEIKRVIIDAGHYSESDYPFHIKADFNILGSVVEISPQGSVISFSPDDSIGNLLGFS